jgi:hypothetical protein
MRRLGFALSRLIVLKKVDGYSVQSKSLLLKEKA